MKRNGATNVPQPPNPKRFESTEENVEDFPNPAEYAIICFTNANATAVRIGVHDTAPPFVWLNQSTQIERVDEVGITSPQEFVKHRAAYGDKFFLATVGYHDGTTWHRTQERNTEVVFPEQGMPTASGTALLIQQSNEQLRPRSEGLAYIVKRKTSTERFVLADPLTPGEHYMVAFSKVERTTGNESARIGSLLCVTYATLPEAYVFKQDKRMKIPFHLGFDTRLRQLVVAGSMETTTARRTAISARTLERGDTREGLSAQSQGGFTLLPPPPPPPAPLLRAPEVLGTGLTDEGQGGFLFLPPPPPSPALLLRAPEVGDARLTAQGQGGFTCLPPPPQPPAPILRTSEVIDARLAAASPEVLTFLPPPPPPPAPLLRSPEVLDAE